MSVVKIQATPTGTGTVTITAPTTNTDQTVTLPDQTGTLYISGGNIGTPSGGNGSNLTNLNASNLASGTVPDARFPATLPAASGVNLTALNASNLGSGTVPTARLATGTANSTTYLRGDQTWATVTGGVTSITAGSGLTGGTITSSGTIALDYYTGSDANNTSFPIGSYVCVDVASAATTARNSTATVRLSSDGGAFIVGGSLSVLAGTWRARGKSGFAISGCTVYVFLLYQRTA